HPAYSRMVRSHLASRARRYSLNPRTCFEAGRVGSADFRPSSFAFVHLQRLAPEAENGGGKFVRALLGQKVAAALGRTALYRAALYAVADRRDRCAQGVADALVPTERQHRHWQPLRGAHLGLGESFRAEIDAVPGEAGSHRA